MSEGTPEENMLGFERPPALSRFMEGYFESRKILSNWQRGEDNGASCFA